MYIDISLLSRAGRAGYIKDIIVRDSGARTCASGHVVLL